MAEKYLRSTGVLKEKRVKLSIAGLPPSLAWLLQEMSRRVANLMAELRLGDIDINQWEREMTRLLTTYGLGAAMAGKDTDELSPSDFERVTRWVETQVQFLHNFAIEIQDTPEFMEGWLNRADLYAAGIKNPYWTGMVDVLPLPAMPTEGSDCGNNCCCGWTIDVLDEAKGDYDCYWELEDGVAHCQTCIERAATWNPIEIRDGMLVSTG